MQLRHPNRPRGLNFVPAKLDQIDQAMPPNIWLCDSKPINLGVWKKISYRFSLYPRDRGRSGSGDCLESASLLLVCLPDWSRRPKLMSSSPLYAYPLSRVDLSRVDILVSQA